MGAAAAAAGPVLGMFGGQLAAYGEYSRGQDELYAAELKAQSADEAAKQTRIQTVEEERRIRVTGTKTLGDIRNTYGAAGVQTTTGSAQDVLEESAKNAELDALWTRYQGEMRARALNKEALSYRIAGRSAEDQANLAATGKSISSIGGGLGGMFGGGAASQSLKGRG